MDKLEDRVKREAREIMWFMSGTNKSFYVKEPLNRRDLIVLRYVYIVIMFLLSYLSIEAEYFLLQQWVAYIHPLTKVDIMLFLFVLSLGALIILLIVAEAAILVASPINKTMVKIWGEVDEHAKMYLSKMPAYKRIPLTVYYFFTFDIDRLIEASKKYQGIV